MSLQSVVFWSAGLTVFKLFLTHTLKIRTRLMTNSLPQPNDHKSSVLQLLLGAFKPIMFAYGPVLFPAARLDCLSQNIIEHEVPVLVLLSLWSNPAGWVTTAALVFTWGRLAHTVAFLGDLQPFRTLVYLPTYMAMGALALGALLGK